MYKKVNNYAAKHKQSWNLRWVEENYL
ncbi:uncharacterized protein METZ01_LOCUS275420, partial [marine metagenome]